MTLLRKPEPYKGPTIPRCTMYHMLLSKNLVGLKRMIMTAKKPDVIRQEILNAKYFLSKCTDIYKVLKTLCDKNESDRWEEKYSMSGFQFTDNKSGTYFNVSTFGDYGEQYVKGNPPRNIWVYVNGQRDILKKESELALYFVKCEIRDIERNISSIGVEQKRDTIRNQLDKF